VIGTIIVRKDNNKLIGDEKMKCPECKSEMVLGYIMAPLRLFWSSIKKKWKILPIVDSEKIIPISWFSIKQIDCWRCFKCNLFIFKKQEE